MNSFLLFIISLEEFILHPSTGSQKSSQMGCSHAGTRVPQGSINVPPRESTYVYSLYTNLEMRRRSLETYQRPKRQDSAWKEEHKMSQTSTHVAARTLMMHSSPPVVAFQRQNVQQVHILVRGMTIRMPLALSHGPQRVVSLSHTHSQGWWKTA